jgi:CheY-like chemotaxis protein
MNIKDYSILMVDDDEEFLFASQSYLKRKECNIMTMSNPIEAIEYLKENDIDVLFIDYFMPQMTGEDVINELRKLNKDFVIVLQTGFAGEKPPMTMYEGITIQGYFDKNDSTEDLMLVLLSALRTAELMRIVKQNAEEKLLRKKKDEYFANKISWITGEIKERLAAMNGPVLVAEEWLGNNQINSEDKEMLQQRIDYLQDNMNKIDLAMNALNIASQREMTSKSMLNMIKELLKNEMWFKKIKINLEISDITCMLDMSDGILPYIICCYCYWFFQHCK